LKLQGKTEGYFFTGTKIQIRQFYRDKKHILPFFSSTVVVYVVGSIFLGWGVIDFPLKKLISGVKFSIYISTYFNHLC
jgi:hypothetical protein